MKSRSCGWRCARNLGRRSYGVFRRWRRRIPDEPISGVDSYIDYVANAAAFEAFRRRELDPLLSAESLPENRSLIDFKSFAQDFPDKLFPLLKKLRPEFQEMFIEYFLLGKDQYFIADCHGFIQTRTWQMLRIIEQTLGAFIILGTDPSDEALGPILQKAGVGQTPYGSLMFMIRHYIESQSYVDVALRVGAPVPAVRKIFRPVIEKLLKSKDVHQVAVGAYLRNLTHQASLSGAGLSKSYLSRLRRIKVRKFRAEPVDESPVMSFGAVQHLKDAPWCMLEISSDHRLTQVLPLLRTQGKKLFGKKPGQIFVPQTADGDLAFGYIFARSVSTSAVRKLLRIRGISEMSSVCNSEGTFVRAVTVPNTDIMKMMQGHETPKLPVVKLGDFVEVLAGDAAHYCGTVTRPFYDKMEYQITVQFPTGRKFLIEAPASCLKVLPNVPPSKRNFWGI